jgi:3-(3-hydroxy-phenyl)propionate hydroxylase
MAADFARRPFGHSPLGTFYQPDFEKALLEGLSRFAHVQTCFEHNVINLARDPTAVVLTIATPNGECRLRAGYVVGCDGGSSTIREKIGSKLKGSTYTERWLVVDAIVKNHDVHQITFRCDPRRPSVELPAVGDRIRWEFMQLPGEDVEALQSEEAARSLIAQISRLRSVQIERKTVYAFHARVADRWRCGRVFLAGDAAHLMPPFAGQGMNGGMKDAANLAWKLSAVLRGQAVPEILATYQSERAPIVTKMVDVSRRLGSVIMPTGRLRAAARDLLFSCLNLSGRFRQFIRRGSVVPPPTIFRSALTENGRDALLRQMMRQPTVSTAQGQLPLDRLLSCHQWLLLGVGTDPAAMLSKRDATILDALDARFICVNGRAASPRTVSVRCDDPDFLDWVKQHRMQGVLVRPDHFIAARLDARRNLKILTPFAGARPVVAMPAAALQS